MFLIIKGEITLVQYFVAMIVSTILLLGVVTASSFLHYDRTMIALAMLILSIISLGASAKIINATVGRSDS